jgi:putative transposase
MELEYGDVVLVPDFPGFSFIYVGYEPSTDEAIIKSGAGEIKQVERDKLLKPSHQDLQQLIDSLVKEKEKEETQHMSEYIVSAEQFTEKQQAIGLRRQELLENFESGKIESREKLMEEMGLKDTAFDEVMRRWSLDPRWQSVAPKTPGRTAGQSDQDPEIIQLYMQTVEEVFGEGVTQKFLYTEFCRRCTAKGVRPFAKSTAGRIFRKIDPRKRDLMSEGSDFVSKKYSPYPSSFELDRPLRRIQIDSSPGDIEVIDSVSGEPLGRPYLTVVSDEYSGGIMAALITFVPPCRATIAAALYQAFLPKRKLLTDLGLANQRWTIYGAPSGILVDKGSEHDNHHFRQTCEKFGIAYEYRKRPQHGGKIENAIKLINVFFIHRLAGSTGSSPKKSKDFNPQKKARYDLRTLQRLVVLEAIRLNDEVREGDRQSPDERCNGYYADPNTPLNMPPMMRDAFGFMINMLPGKRVFVRGEGIKYCGYVYGHGDLGYLVGRKSKVSVRRSPLDLHTLYVLHNGIWKIHKVLKPSRVPKTLIEAQIWKRSRPKAGEMTQVGHDAITEIQDIIASTISGSKKRARAQESVALAKSMGIIPDTEEDVQPEGKAVKIETNRFAHVKPFQGEDD